jgi:hypothetical protein
MANNENIRFISLVFFAKLRIINDGKCCFVVKFVFDTKSFVTKFFVMP